MKANSPAAIKPPGPPPRPLRLHRDRFPGESLLDTAVSHAMLRRVATETVGESLRLYVPENALLFSSLDARRPGFARALALAEQAGFPSVIRLAGGQAAVFLEESVAFAWAVPDPEAHLHIRRRFEDLSAWVVASLRRLGLDARVGPVAGEYCPGQYSVNLGGRIKVMGVGQRVIKGGAHVGGVITIGRTDLLRDILVPIYQALDIEFRPETAGGISDFDPLLGPEDVIAAMSENLSELGYRLEPTHFDMSIRREAEALIPIHAPGTRSGLGAVLRATRRDGKTLVQAEPGGSPRDTTGTEDS
jgi:octanoyl-[GcvH]:protein N-octanoyltransferase